MNHLTEKTVYELVTGKPASGKLIESEPAGYAVRFGSSRHYVVRPKSRSGRRYFVLKKPYSKLGYLVFAKLSRTKRGPRFRDEAGHATLSEELKSHLEIRIKGIDQPLFMNLYPLSR